jgi:hypothetical protein
MVLLLGMNSNGRTPLWSQKKKTVARAFWVDVCLNFMGSDGE